MALLGCELTPIRVGGNTTLTEEDLYRINKFQIPDECVYVKETDDIIINYHKEEIV